MQEDSESNKDAAEGSKKELHAAKWVTPYFQKKAFSEAWLAFFRLQAPEDVFRKVIEKTFSHHLKPWQRPILRSSRFEAFQRSGLRLDLFYNFHLIFSP